MLHIKNMHAELIWKGLQHYHSLLLKTNLVLIRPVWRLTEIELRRNLGITKGLRYNHVMNIVGCNNHRRGYDGEAICHWIDYNPTLDSILALDGLGFRWR